MHSCSTHRSRDARLYAHTCMEGLCRNITCIHTEEHESVIRHIICPSVHCTLLSEWLTNGFSYSCKACLVVMWRFKSTIGIVWKQSHSRGWEWGTLACCMFTMQIQKLNSWIIMCHTVLATTMQVLSDLMNQSDVIYATQIPQRISRSGNSFLGNKVS